MSAQLTPDKLSENVIKLNIVSPKFKANSNAETDDEDDDFEILMMKMSHPSLCLLPSLCTIFVSVTMLGDFISPRSMAQGPVIAASNGTWLRRRRYRDGTCNNSKSMGSSAAVRGFCYSGTVVPGF
ncbi:Hypothetical predicted protein [Olea europaea subsp. europaea]|uniref:Uncharacterized protein n=1 Tax=Olea europaea subsp. europaea TaxID=158383 RepID=A0A8S0V0A3_OLEEU|nr:Hypothetical predicted protein [Olea europaea subsp. europaea]